MSEEDPRGVTSKAELKGAHEKKGERGALCPSVTLEGGELNTTDTRRTAEERGLEKNSPEEGKKLLTELFGLESQKKGGGKGRREGGEKNMPKALPTGGG